MLPSKVIVAGVTYTIEEKEYVEINDNANALGSCTYDKALIEVKSTMSDERKEEVFVHELFHAILNEAGFDGHDEDLVNRASKVLYQVMKDNPNMLNSIGDVKQVVINQSLTSQDIQQLMKHAALEVIKP